LNTTTDGAECKIDHRTFHTLSLLRKDVDVHQLVAVRTVEETVNTLLELKDTG
jgi:hypothetical protein